MKTEEQERKEKIAMIRRHVIRVLLFCIVFALILSKWGVQLQNYIQSHKWFLLLLVVGIILYISWAFPVFFRDYKQNLRRTWYFFLVIGVVLLLKESGFQTNDWQRYLYLTGMFIFVDLAFFLTPTIKKFGGTEMEMVQEVENINKEMQKALTKTKGRSKIYTSILSRVETEPFGTLDWSDGEDYRISLEDFLAYYGEACMQEITVLLKPNDGTFATQLSSVLGIELEQEQLDKLEKEEIVQLDTHQVLIPFSHQLHPVVIVVISQKEPLIQVDFDHIIDLAIIHTWYKKKEEISEEVSEESLEV
jgi:hypothetical protein